MLPEITDILNLAKERIQSNLSDKGINASGRTSESFKVVEYDGGIRLVYDNSNGGAPLLTTEDGRTAGPVLANFTDIIEQWSRDKPINFSSDKERRRFAGAVAWGKIRKRGFGRPSPSDYGSFDRTVYSNVVLETAAELRREVPKIGVAYIKSILR